MKKFISKSITLLMAIASAGMLSACLDDKVAGGVTEDAGLAIKDLDVAGLAQKGPFVKGSVVTVQGIDCKTMALTGEVFEGKVKSDKGDFEVKDVNLSSTCAVFEVTGYYFNELTGKKSSDKLTLHTLTDLKDRKNVNINLLTELEYERVMNLAAGKETSFTDAKKQAEKEVLAAFNVKAKDGEFAQFEDLNIFKSGDDNATLLAVSVLMQSDLKVAKLTERVNDVATDIAKDGSWDDDKTKTEIAEWTVTADKNGDLANVGKNIEKWGGSDDVSAFETVVEKFAENVASDTASVSASSSSKKAVSSSSRVILSSGSREESSDSKKVSSSSWTGKLTYGTGEYLNSNIQYDSIVDSRDGQVYKTVKIGDQVWMAQNLNYSDSVKTPSLVGRTGCYVVDDPDCKWSGRGYSWAAAIDSVALANDPENPVMCGHNRVCNFTSHVRGICPEGWHLPDTTEWNNLFAAVGGRDVAGLHLKAKMGWHSDSNGVDDYGFSAIATDFSVDVYGDRVYRRHTNFWSSVENGLTKSVTAYLEAASEMASISDKSPKYAGSTLNGQRYAGYMIRCLKDE
ncbi:fibrobacter succinogenes major paralogous domain-containing protein [uncultured Fibrobacter sp.]|uniref:fibrobacter succinogenes major paralogous domain-containing protein n=1 Tax=uncultured Fibrobacter sp. TaxID=261512 RepID=UPI0025E43C31|nr:fibrobacter succinogenes major paralogous domain-containing protein [uncultured Fibrobacter sp.]